MLQADNVPTTVQAVGGTALLVLSKQYTLGRVPLGSLVHTGGDSQPIEKKTEVTSDMMICEKIVRELQECSDLELACLGYYADAVDDGIIRNKLNHRLITANDGEHKACKGGIRITRTLPAYRISRRIAPTQPSFHPIHCDIEWPPAVYDIAHDAVHAFDQLVIKNKWPQLHELFLTGFEKSTR